MHDLIRRIAQWLSLVLAPGTGTRRAGARPAPTRAHATTSRPTPVPATPTPRLPRHRSPYGLGPDRPFDGTTTPLVRPYLVAYEGDQERTRQRYRRLALVLAADFGVDLDQRVIGAREVTA
ncbi:hypothetical protein [Streptomyces thermolilacinus]|uniref:hypothetical protein n=1 Tax=Streptomyces thermolilacinus TaxID=285540 RepID=UPI0033FB7898